KPHGAAGTGVPDAVDAYHGAGGDVVAVERLGSRLDVHLDGGEGRRGLVEAEALHGRKRAGRDLECELLALEQAVGTLRDVGLADRRGEHDIPRLITEHAGDVLVEHEARSLDGRPAAAPLEADERAGA